MISQTEWGFLIIATSYITIITFIVSFIPLGLNSSLNYFIPRYIALKQNNKIKSLIYSSILIRSIVVISVFLITLGLIFFIPNLFMINLNNYIYLLYILSPLIIVISLENLCIKIIEGMGFFKIEFLFSIFRAIINIGALIFIIIFIKPIKIELIAFVNLFSMVIPFLFLIITILIKLSNVKETNDEKLTFKEVLKNTLNYGSYIDGWNISQKIWNEIKKQAIGIFSMTSLVTGYNISKRYSEVTSISITSLTSPLTVSFSSLDSKNQFDQIGKIFKISLRYIIFVLSFLVGILFFFTDFFLFLVYGEDYLIYSLLMKIMLINTFFNPLASLFYSLLKAINKVKLMFKLQILFLSIKIFLFFTFIVYYDIYGAIIGQIIANILHFIVLIYLSKISFKMDINIKKISYQYMIFFVSIGLALILSLLFLDNLNLYILNLLGLTILKNLNLFTVLVFLITFLMLNVILKIITKEDIEYLEGLFSKRKQFHRFLIKILKKLKVFIRYSNE